MRKTTYFNQLDATVMKKLGVDKLIDPVVIKLVHVRFDPDNPSQPLIPVYKRIPNKDIIIVDGVSYDIAAIASVSQDNASLYEIGFWKDEGGFKRLNPRNARDKDLLEFLLISNYNASNPYRDPNIQPLFEVFRPEEKAKQRVADRMQKIEAITLAASMSEEELREFAASVGWNEAEDVFVLKDQVLTWCEKDPNGFIEAQSSRSRYVLATLKRAESRNIVAKNAMENAWYWGASQQVMCTLPRSSTKDMYQLFVDWYMSEDRAVRVFQELESIVYGRSHVSKAPSVKEEVEEESSPQSKRRRAKASE